MVPLVVGTTGISSFKTVRCKGMLKSGAMCLRRIVLNERNKCQFVRNLKIIATTLLYN